MIEYQKTGEATGDLIGNKIANKFTGSQKFTTKQFRDSYK